MNGARYAAHMEMDALELFGVGGGSSGSHHHPETNNNNLQQAYRGPQSESYDPSAAAAPNRTMASYTHTMANAPGIHSQTQQQQQQAQLQGFPTAADYLAMQSDSLLTSLLSPAPAYGQPPQAHLAARPQYQQHTIMSAAGARSPNPFDPLPMLNAAGVQQHQHALHAPNVEEMILHALATQAGAPAVSRESSAPAGSDNLSYNNSGSGTSSIEPTQAPTIQRHNEPWLEEIKVTVTSLSLEPLTGSEVVARLQDRMNDVVTKYLPCVDFLVQCQQELRKGLIHAQQHQKRSGSSRRYFQNSGMTPRQFWTTYVSRLPEKFLAKNRLLMESSTLTTAVQALEKLREEAKTSAVSSCEAVKNSFLGGMKEGESWGLRKWLSRHGNALAVCTDLECILKALKALDKDSESTKKLAKLLRPMAEQTLKKLKTDVPSSYQERSSAHPYLPFFHRLESALRDTSQFDPEDDGIICLDDSDDDDVVEVAPPPPPPRKRAAKTTPARKRKTAKRDDFKPPPRKKQETPAPPPPPKVDTPPPPSDDGSSSGSDEECEIVEVVGVTPIGATALGDDDEFLTEKNWRCKNCSAMCPGTADSCITCGEANHNKILGGEIEDASSVLQGGDFEEFEAIVRNSDLFSDDDLPSFPQHCDEDELAAALEEPAPKPKKRKKSPKANKKLDDKDTSHVWPRPIGQEEFDAAVQHAEKLSKQLEMVAHYFRENRENEIRPVVLPASTPAFWRNGENFAEVLELFSRLLQNSEVVHFMKEVDDDLLSQINPQRKRYSHVIKNPLSFPDVVAALFVDMDGNEGDEAMLDYKEGELQCSHLKKWNMWNGKELLMTLDLVLLNSLAFGKMTDEGRSRHRGRTNELRKILWDGIKNIVRINASEEKAKKNHVPVKRGELSGFVVFKYSEGEDNSRT